MRRIREGEGEDEEEESLLPLRNDGIGRVNMTTVVLGKNMA